MNSRLALKKVVFSIIVATSAFLVLTMYGITWLSQIQDKRVRATIASAPTMTMEALEFHYQKGVGNINIGRWQEAKEELEFVFEIDPKYKDVQAKLAEIYAKITETPVPSRVVATSALTAVALLSTIQFQAADFEDGINIWVDDGSGDPCRRGLVYNAWPFNERSNSVQYSFEGMAGTYYLEIAYAAAEERVVEVVLNGQLITTSALKEITGGWCNKDVKWEQIGRVELQNGINLLKLSRSRVFPHIKEIRFVPVK